MFTDTHCHISLNDYDNPEEIIKNACENNIKKIIVSGCNKKSSLEALSLADKYSFVYFTLGCHPSELEDLESTIKIIENNIKNPKFLAIGEIGLDYHYEGYDKEKQKEAFIKQLSIAKKYGKKVVIHTRDAEIDTYEILQKSDVTGVIHSFSGNEIIAKKYIDLGFYLGINGTITFKNSNLKSIIKDIPIDKILLETDSPYLSPEPFRGQKNEPKNILIIAQYISQVLNISLADLSTRLEENLHAIFDIKD